MAVELICQQCGKRYLVKPSVARKGRRHCSKKCHNESMRRRVQLVCKHCGKNFSVIPSRSHQQYCSRRCRDMVWNKNLTPDQRRKYPVNDNALNEWTPFSSYVLGLLAADGCIRDTRGRQGSYITISNIDRILPEIVRELLAPTKPLYEHKTATGTPLYRCDVHSKPLVARLIQLGLVPRKSSVLRFPPVPNHVLGHFARGYLDGDGTVCIIKGQRVKGKDYPRYRGLLMNFVGTPEFLGELSSRLSAATGVRAKNLKHRPEAKNCAVLQYRSKESCRLFHYLYGPTSEDPSGIPHLPRKWQRFMDFKDYALAKGYWRME